MALQPAEVRITATSATCVRYELIADGTRIWSNRVAPTEEGHAGAGARMAAWALKHKVLMQEAKQEAAAEPAAARRSGQQ